MNYSINQILDVVSGLFNQFGVRSISMDEVASTLGISKKTLYRNFQDKEDLIRRVIEYKSGQLADQTRKLMEEPNNALGQMMEIQLLMEKVAGELSIIMDYDLKKYYPSLYELLHTSYYGRLYSLLTSNIKKGILEGIYIPDIPVEKVARLQMLRVMELPQSIQKELEPRTTFEFSEDVLGYHFRAFVKPDYLPEVEEYIKDWKHINH